MAVIGKIRERSTLVLIIVGGAIMAFVLTDLFSAKAGGQQGPVNLGEVNDDYISPTEFEIEVQRAYENYKLNMQAEGPLDERTKSTIREQVWNQKLSDILIGNQMKELGLDVTTKELFDMVQGDNPHPQVKQAFTDPNTGQFKKEAVIQFLQNLDNDPEAKERWLVFERAIKRNQKMEKYNNLLTKGVYWPSQLAAKDYNDQNTTLSFKYVYKPFSAINDTTITVSESEMKDYYNEHKEEYEQEASTKVLYAYFPVAPSAKDLDATRNFMENARQQFEKAENDSIFVNANSDDSFDPTFYSIDKAPRDADTSLWSKEVGAMTGVFNIDDNYYVQKVTKVKMAPDSVNASHILISAEERSPERAQTLADSLQTALNNGADFAELAMTFSDDVGSAQKGGELGWFTEGMMVKPFNDAAFSAELGEVVKAESQFGIHLIKVTDKTALKRKVQLAVVRREALASKETYEIAFNQANSFSIEANDLETFNSLVREQNVQRRSAVLGPNDNMIQGLPASRDLVRWVNDADQGDVSEAYDTDDAFVVAYVEQVNEKGIPPFESVKNRVEYFTKQEKKANMFIEEMSGASELGTLASNLGLSVENATNVTFANPRIPQVGTEPEVVGKAMTLEAGQMSVPIKGKTGVFVVQLDQKSDAGEANLVAIRSANNRALKARVDNGAVLNALKEKADITDNRSKFY
ncbi:MAG: peptidylprolyl isomerase [Vicingaceae bacterium]